MYPWYKIRPQFMATTFVCIITQIDIIIDCWFMVRLYSYWEGMLSYLPLIKKLSLYFTWTLCCVQHNSQHIFYMDDSCMDGGVVNPFPHKDTLWRLFRKLKFLHLPPCFKFFSKLIFKFIEIFHIFPRDVFKVVCCWCGVYERLNAY